MSADAFLTLHRNLLREGPGEPADVAWLGQQITLPEGAQIADLACGPGADIGPLLDLAPNSHVVAVDHLPHLLEQAAGQWAGDPRVDIRMADMRDPGGEYDLIWCAGAVYFLGVTQALEMWKPFLKPGGAIAFTEPCFWSDPPDPEVAAIWAEYPAMGAEASVAARVQAAGFKTLATRRLSEDAWSAYYTPMTARIAKLRPDASPELHQILDSAEAEITAWHQYGDEFGYLLSIVRPQ